MKKPIAIALSTLAMTMVGHGAEETSMPDRLKAELAKAGPSAFVDPGYKPGIIRHIVLFRFKEEATAAQRQDVMRRFKALATEAARDGEPYIVSIEAGYQASGEDTDQGFEQAYVVTFRSEGDRNYYVGTPIIADAEYFDAAHQAFKEFVGPLLAKKGVIVFDLAVGGMTN